MVQWLGVCAFTAKGLGLIPGHGTKIPQATKQKNKNKKIYIYIIYIIHIMYIYTKLNHLAVQQKLTTYCKSTILQF